MADATPTRAPEGATGVLVLASGDVIWGRGFGAEGEAVGEVCFHTAITGYQEIMTDPSFEGQVITFTFPHIGNVGANHEDVEANHAHALGCIVREDVTAPSNFRAAEGFGEWLTARGKIGISGVDTRALTRRIRAGGAPNGVIAHSASGRFDIDALLAKARAWPGLEGMDLAKDVSCEAHHSWEGGVWELGFGYEGSEPRPSTSLGTSGSLSAGPSSSLVPSEVEGRSSQPSTLVPSEVEGRGSKPTPLVLSEVEGRAALGAETRTPHIVAIDYGSKYNIFRNLVKAGAQVTVLPATATFDEVMAHNPDGFFLSNGPGDPAATGEYAVPVIRQMLETGKPLFGICLGHQLLALAIGAKTTKMFQGHRGANHPVKRLEDGRVEITSMNHGFAVERGTLPENARETHVSLFDNSNCGIELTDRPAFSVQYHPEASPGPMDSMYLFKKFVEGLS